MERLSSALMMKLGHDIPKSGVWSPNAYTYTVCSIGSSFAGCEKDQTGATLTLIPMPCRSLRMSRRLKTLPASLIAFDMIYDSL